MLVLTLNIVCAHRYDYIMLDYEIDPKLCFCTWLLGGPQLKSWGVKKNSVPYMTEIVLTNILV